MIIDDEDFVDVIVVLNKVVVYADVMRIPKSEYERLSADLYGDDEERKIGAIDAIENIVNEEGIDPRDVDVSVEDFGLAAE